MKTTMPTSVLTLEIDLVAENTTSVLILQQKDALKNAQKLFKKPITAAQKAAAQEAKEVLENRLIDVGDTIGVRGPLSNVAYLRYMSRDDSTLGYVVDVPVGMFVGQEEFFSITINASDILEMWTNGKLDASIVTYFNLYMGLYKLMQSSSNCCGLLNPYLIQGSQCLHNTSAVKDYLTRAFSSTYDIFLTPFIEKENHWVLFVVSPKPRMCYILDSHQPKIKKRIERSYWLTSCLNKFVANYKVVECNPQAGLWECGYYVLQWMHEFVTVHQDHFPETIPWHDNRTFSMSQIEDTIEKWYQLCPI
ncbi:ulp1 protease family, C-terminal catalytic domain-containing protein [Tanacetum coccineum]